MTGDSWYASGAVRDQFLKALDSPDCPVPTELVATLQNCMNPFPGDACEQLGLPKGSTYGCAARRVLALQSTCMDASPAPIGELSTPPGVAVPQAMP